MTWKLLLLAACGVLTGAVIRSLSFGKPPLSDFQHKLKVLNPEEYDKRVREEEQRLRGVWGAEDAA